MLSHTYSYEECLHNSLKVAGRKRTSEEPDSTTEALPAEPAGGRRRDRLSRWDEKRKLNRSSATPLPSSLCREFIVPQTLQEAQRDVYGEEALCALLRFAEEEIRGQQMFRRSMAMFGKVRHRGVIPGREDGQVRSRKVTPVLAVLTSMIEWFTQRHTSSTCAQRSSSMSVPRSHKYHWIEAATHAKLDSLVINEIVGPLSLEQRERAVDELLELGGAIDGLLAQQADLDIESLQRALRRTFADHERAEIKTSIQRGYRWTFLVSGLTHPTFARIVGELTEQGPRRIAAAAEALSA
jgi:hypothetical protein